MFFRKRDKVVLTLTPQEARYARSILLRWRNKLLNAGKPTEDVEELILRLARYFRRCKSTSLYAEGALQKFTRLPHIITILPCTGADE